MIQQRIIFVTNAFLLITKILIPIDASHHPCNDVIGYIYLKAVNMPLIIWLISSNHVSINLSLYCFFLS